MRRSAFTWIELIFVILILGVLAATAVVKLGGMSDRANEVQLKAFAGTLNRSSGGGFWYRSLNDGHTGSVALVEYDAIIDQYIETIAGYVAPPKLSACNLAGDGVFVEYQYTDLYAIHCKDGSRHESPSFRLYNVTKGEYVP